MKKTICLFLLYFLLNNPAYSQDIKSSTSGFAVGMQGTYSNWFSESFFLSDLAELEPNGVGFNAIVSYGFTQRISANLSYSSLNFNRNENWDRFNNAVLGLSVRFNFGATLHRFRPFFEIGGTSTGLAVDPISIDGSGEFELINSGLGFKVGGGLETFIISNLAISLQANYNIGTFSNITVSGESYPVVEDVDFTYFQANLGLKYYF